MKRTFHNDQSSRLVEENQCMNTLNPTEPGHAPQEGCDKREKRATETGGGGVAFEIAGERPETSLRVVLKVEVLVSEGSHVNDTRGGEHQTWTERERDANLTPSGVSDIPSLTPFHTHH